MMKTILILGIGPLTIHNSDKFHSGGNRAWHFAKPLLDHDYKVVLLCMRITDHANPARQKEEILEDGNLTCYLVDEVTHFANDDYVKQIIAKHQPDAIVGACGYPAFRAVSVADGIPVWADIHGYPMGEAQAKAYQCDEPGYVHHFWNTHREVLRKADRFSVTSERQRMATIGELGVMGRLNHKTFGEELVTQIPCSWDSEIPFEKHSRQKSDPFYVFFCGGYNLWCDPETLFKALELAMQKDERIRFLSTGGAIDGHDDKTYPAFKAMVDQSPFANRFELHGWVSNDELKRCYHKAHLGINVDRPCYETLIGARNRLIEFMARGVPILTTLGTEISQILFYKGLVFTVPMENSELLAGEILLAANHPDKLDTMATNARKLFEQQYTYSVTSQELLAWCANPQHSQDYGQPVLLDYRTETERQQVSSAGILRRIRHKLGY